MNLLLASICIIFLGGLTTPLSGSKGPAAAIIAGSVLGLIPTIATLAGNALPELALPWSYALGEFRIGLDPLSALFLLPTYFIAVLLTIYAPAYLKEHICLRRHWFFLNLLIASMILVLCARDAILFILSWETMSLCPLFLIMTQEQRRPSRQAAWIYFVATHLGALCLLAFFILGSSFSSQASATPANPGLLFILALIGFGTKAGIFPLHIWLPEAHPTAPSHISAYMSGVMIKMGVYGLLRALTFLGAPQLWWGVVLILLGLASGLLGIIFALAQHNLKRMLAYCSIENIGIIFTGLGLGLIGQARGDSVLTALGFGGALLHVINHAIFKSLLFMGAGSIQHATGTLDINQLGGLLKRMPYSSASFMLGSAAICGLPPLNGFISKFMIYLGALYGLSGPDRLFMIGIIAGLPFIGGLAALTFTKACGIALLGEPRSSRAARAHEAPPAMLVPLLILTGICLTIGLAGHAVTFLISPVVGDLEFLKPPLDAIQAVGLLLVALTAFFWLLRRLNIQRRPLGSDETWSCGYSATSSRLQYTGSSFSATAVHFFRPLLNTRERHADLNLRTATPDIFTRAFYGPLLRLIRNNLARLSFIQSGRVHLYILYLVLALVISLIFTLGGGL